LKQNKKLKKDPKIGRKRKRRARTTIGPGPAMALKTKIITEKI
jgi:hypothetical protein